MSSANFVRAEAYSVSQECRSLTRKAVFTCRYLFAHLPAGSDLACVINRKIIILIYFTFPLDGGREWKDRSSSGHGEVVA